MAASQPQPPRYLPNVSDDDDEHLIEIDTHKELITSLTSIVQGCPPKKPWTDLFKDKPMGLWTGPTSLAYLLLWLSKTHPDLTVESRQPLEWCTAYLECGQADIPGPKGLNGWGVKNEYLAFHTVRACATQNMDDVAKVKAAVEGDLVEVCPAVDNEHLSGRAGTLALLRMIRHWIPEAAETVTGCMGPLIDHIIASKPWRFHGHNYIGAAHGQIGIITQVVLCDPSRISDILPELNELLDLQTEEGHWFITDDPELGAPDLVHHCHGSPGFVMSLMKIRRFFDEEIRNRIDRAIERGRKEIWKLGLLTKEPNLCHGITGNMLAFEDWGKRRWFMGFATREAIENGKKDGRFVAGDDPWGLLWGEGGRAWGWMVMDAQVDLGYPSYTDI
ncbi:hypothetical protein F5Y16DRAFT_416145 [Xylariaceae sp. FL0255]|nr:hypothetical protein F5Y16DRAFT_416145 [Xylariaceae sp. FL0255]